MFYLIIFGSLIVMGIGLIAKFILDWRQSQYRIDNKELLIASLVLLLLAIPLTSYVGMKLAVKQLVTFNENWGGYEVSVEKVVHDCYKDGGMKHYWVHPEYESYTTTCGSGKNTYTCTQWHWVDHDIPYTTEEWSYVVHTTLGDYTVADRQYPDHPNKYRYWSDTPVPNVPEETGATPFWLAAKQRIENNNPGPVTARRQYANYILASQSSILKRYSGSIDGYKKAGILPAINNQTNDFYYSDRAYFVGTHPAGDWQAAINRFDAALGKQSQGDLHLVIVNANAIKDPDDYSLAVLAYWESPAFAKDALSKNGIVVIIGTNDGQTIAWARAGTGMPAGNEAMVVDIQNDLKGVALNPDSVLGQPKGNIVGADVKVTHPEPQGALGKALWGIHAFKRVHMGKPGQKGNVGYAYLFQEIEPTSSQRAWMYVIIILLGCIAWTICIFHGAPQYRDFRGRPKYRSFDD